MTAFGDSDTWNTPPSIVALVRAVMGGIDVDPASNDSAQSLVQAATFYTLETDGLAHEWPGRIFLNPPYSNVEPFVSKLFAELDVGRTTQAIALVNARSSSAWFQALAARAWRCELRQRPRFWRPERPEGSKGRLGSVAFYIGPNVSRFVATFGSLGTASAPAVTGAVTPSCRMCGAPLAANARVDAATCSDRCRKRLERSRKRAATLRGAA